MMGRESSEGFFFCSINEQSPKLWSLFSNFYSFYCICFQLVLYFMYIYVHPSSALWRRETGRCCSLVSGPVNECHKVNLYVSADSFNAFKVFMCEENR